MVPLHLADVVAQDHVVISVVPWPGSGVIIHAENRAVKTYSGNPAEVIARKDVAHVVQVAWNLVGPSRSQIDAVSVIVARNLVQQRRADGPGQLQHGVLGGVVENGANRGIGRTGP